MAHRDLVYTALNSRQLVVVVCKIGGGWPIFNEDWREPGGEPSNSRRARSCFSGHTRPSAGQSGHARTLLKTRQPASAVLLADDLGFIDGQTTRIRERVRSESDAQLSRYPSRPDTAGLVATRQPWLHPAKNQPCLTLYSRERANATAGTHSASSLCFA